MTDDLFSYSEGQRLAVEGADRAHAASDAAFKAHAEATILEVGRMHPTFTADDVVRWCQVRGLPLPENGSAWGSVFRRLSTGKRDRLGLDVIYLQAKRWAGNVSRPEIQKFAGALQGKRAKKGIFITTSDFTAEAREFVKNIDAKIILISGRQLAEFMWEYNLGMSSTAIYEVKKIDLDYFSE